MHTAHQCEAPNHHRCVSELPTVLLRQLPGSDTPHLSSDTGALQLSARTLRRRSPTGAAEAAPGSHTRRVSAAAHSSTNRATLSGRSCRFLPPASGGEVARAPGSSCEPRPACLPTLSSDRRSARRGSVQTALSLQAASFRAPGCHAHTQRYLPALL